jgi:hypothetical protein
MATVPVGISIVNTFRLVYRQLLQRVLPPRPAFSFAAVRALALTVGLLLTIHVSAAKAHLAVLVPAAAQAGGPVRTFRGHFAFPLLFSPRVEIVAHGADGSARRIVPGNGGVGNLF